ncbi:hypothetical protein [Flagellimonas okinawensis]|uniref:Uncharacterized protein n=1 Tax=Flagellimonas okinawensis TaxID=3031324 RepID=A0ABT5XLW0_9FLAO|nr:hypothetical protein [[Muricauda] okinawensis]MDF0706616.1 hypothetical protein [[Muricauda] okinawensis]
MSEFEPLLKEMDEKMSTFLRSPDHFVDLRKFYARPEHITNEKYNEWEKLHAQGKACYYIQNNSKPQTYNQKGTPIYHPKVACLFENDNSIFSGDIVDGHMSISSIGYFKSAYVAGYTRGMVYCIENLELSEERFLKNYSPEYLESILYFYNKKEVSLIEGVQKGSVFVKSYVPTKGMPEVLYEYGFHSCVVWYIENLMEKFPDKFKRKKVGRGPKKGVEKFSDMFSSHGEKIESDLIKHHFKDGFDKKKKMFWTKFLCICHEKGMLVNLTNKEYARLINENFNQDYKENNMKPFSDFKEGEWFYNKDKFDFSFI